MKEYLIKRIYGGVVFALAVFGTTILAVAISGTITTWTTGQVLKSSDLNTTITSLQTAIQNIPNWTKNSTSAYYTDGNVGIGTSNPSFKMDVSGSNSTLARLNNSSAINGAETFVLSAAVSSQTGLAISQWDSGGIGTAWITFANTNHTTHTSDIQLSTRNFSTGLIVKDSGSVGIGTTSPSQMLTVNGNAGNTTGVWVNNSDKRLKKNIQPLGNFLEKLTELRPVTFEWKDPKKLNAKDGKHIGFIAQEVEKVFPYWVDTDKDGMKWLSMEGVNAAFVQSFKEVALRLRSGNDRISAVTQKIEFLEKEKAANEKKLLALEEDNKRLRETVDTMRATSLRTSQQLEDRLRAIENMQMAKK